MIEAGYILAQAGNPQDDPEMRKIVIGIVIAVVWWIAGMISAASKKKSPPRMDLPAPPPPAPAHPPPQPAPAMKSNRPPRTPQRMPQRQVRTKSGLQRALESVPIRPVTPVSESITIIPPVASVNHHVSANATRISTWLTPATLKQQFILTEILQPPLAMREIRP
jgi:hypothetical protein